MFFGWCEKEIPFELANNLFRKYCIKRERTDRITSETNVGVWNSTLERAVWVRALAGVIALCSWALNSLSASLHPGV